MAKSPATSTRRRSRPRTVREELSNPNPPDLTDVGGLPEHEDESEPAAADTARPAAAPRLSLPLTADGAGVDWERVRNADRARAVLGLNVSQEAAGSAADGVFGADMIGLALDMLSSALVSVTKAAGYTVDSSELMRLGEQEKAAIIPRATKVLGKHAPQLGKWEDEIALGVTLSVIFAGKLMSLKKAGTVSTFPRKVEPAATTAPIDGEAE